MLKGFKNSPELDFSIPENKEAMLKAFEQVDKAMYGAKKKGKNTYQIYES